MVAVLDRLVATVFTVTVLSHGVLGGSVVLVVVVAVLGVTVTVVQVVDVVAVLDRLVATVFTVAVLGRRVLSVFVIGHDAAPSLGRSSPACVSASATT